MLTFCFFYDIITNVKTINAVSSLSGKTLGCGPGEDGSNPSHGTITAKRIIRESKPKVEVYFGGCKQLFFFQEE